MGIDVKLADRIREALSGQKKVEERKMFAGMCLMVDDKMCICLRDDRMMCRVGPEKFAEAVERNGASPMIHGSRMMKGFVFVEPEGYKAKKDFEYWIRLCLEFNKIAKPSKKSVKK
jgi:TfoX/Sxy family transcriptional regulator of competence genes